MTVELASFYINSAFQENARHQFGNARQLSQLAVNLAPAIPEGWFNLGIAEMGLGQREAALAALSQADLRTRESAPAQNSIGLKLLELKAFKAAEDCLTRAIQLAPQSAEAHSNLGRLHQEQGDLEHAASCLQEAVRLAPEMGEFHANLGLIQLLRKRFIDAEEASSRAIKLAPHLAHAWLVSGKALLATRKLDESARHCLHALQIEPALPEAWSTLGCCYLLQHRLKEAEHALRKELTLAPDAHDVWLLLSNVLRKSKRPSEALEAMRLAFQRGDADQGDVLGEYVQAKLEVCDWHGLDELTRSLEHAVEEGVAVSPFTLILLEDAPGQILKASTTYTQKTRPKQTAASSALRNDDDKRPIHIGFFSADLRTHPVAQQLVEMLEHHDRSKFRFIGFSFTKVSDDPLRDRVSLAMDDFLEVHHMSDAAVVQRAQELGIDIAIDLNGYTDGCRPNIFAMRAAPIQVSYLGYPATLGASYMDYVIADCVVIPPGSEAYFKEKVVRLPHCFMPHDNTQPIAEKKSSRQDFDLPEDGFVFCCFNNHSKINPEVFDAWMQLLRRTSGSVLWLSEGNKLSQENLRKEASARGVAPGRLIFARRTDTLAEHLARQRLSDLFLDTWPYNAHTTASDALWAGVPVLTYACKTFAGRVAASMLHALDLQELVADSTENYVEKALALVEQRDRLISIRNRLEARLHSCPLFDSARLARAMERAFIAMWERRRHNQAADHIQVSDALS